MSSFTFDSICLQNDAAIRSLRQEQPQCAIGCLRQALLWLQNDLNSTPNIAIITSAQVVVSLASVGPLVDFYQTAFSFRNCPSYTKQGESLRMSHLSMSDQHLVSTMLLYNISLAYQILGMNDHSQFTKAISISRRCYSMTLQLLLQSCHHPSVPCSSIQTISKTDIPKIMMNLDVIAEVFGKDERGFILLTTACNLRQIHYTLFDTESLMIATALFNNALRLCLSHKLYQYPVDFVRRENSGCHEKVSQPLQHCTTNQLLTDEDAAFFFFSLLIPADKLMELSPAA